VGDIRTKPATKAYRDGYDRIFKRTPKLLDLDKVLKSPEFTESLRQLADLSKREDA
jgi:hypothetical protein